MLAQMFDYVLSHKLCFACVFLEFLA